jgi:MFS family permease
MSQDRTALKLSLMGLAGASIEWYDFLLYGTAAALVFPTVFFPASMPPFVAQIASFSTFAVGFIARPFGGILFGHLGDKVGRKTTFVMALMLMGLATMLIAFLPSYRTAGAFAPIALVLLRLAQGLAVGGQWGGATLIATESAPPARRGYFGGITQAGVFIGVLLANIAVLAASGLTTQEQFMRYGWRIPFLLSVVLVGLSLFIHYRAEETAAFRATETTQLAASPIIQAIRQHPGRILLGAGVLLPLHATFYVVVTYAIAYGTSASGLQLPRSAILGGLLIAQCVAAPICVIAGALSDRYGRRRIMMTGVTLMGLSGLAFFPLLERASFGWIALALTMASTCNGVAYGPLGTLFAELFDTRLRYSGMSLAYQLGAILGGGFVPMIATALFARFHTNMWTALYIVFTALVALFCLSRLKETAGTEFQSHASPATMANEEYR